MNNSKRNITQCEMLLAIAMSELHQTTHVLFIPPNTHYTDMLVTVRRLGLVEPKTKNYYTVTKKGWNLILTRQKGDFKAQDKEIDDFIKSL
jgi:predicted transcriptional regulator